MMFENVKNVLKSIDWNWSYSTKKCCYYCPYQGLPNGPMNLHTAALRPENSTKNRYKKIYPCTFWKNNQLDSLFSNSYVWILFNIFFYLFILIDDDNRVILDPPQDYINASYIQVKDKLCIFNVLKAVYSDNQ